jgi:hypothetical protein
MLMMAEIRARITTQGEALMEFVVRHVLGLRVDPPPPGIGHLPQWRATGRRHSRRWGVLAQAGEDLAHGHPLVDEGDDAQLAAAPGAQQREDLGQEEGASPFYIELDPGPPA